MVRWKLYPNFSKEEFDCKHTGNNEMRPEFLETLQQIRIDYGKPMIITSGYRDVTHPLEARKTKGGTHTLGIACDIGVNRKDALDLVECALAFGIKRIGINQKGEGRFIHLDIGDKYGFPESIWSY